MHLTHLHLLNFKNYADAEITFSPRLNGLVGDNGSGKTNILERHRHRYEFNSDYLESLENAGLKASGVNPDTGLVEIVEIENHPFFIGVQYHPEYKSTVDNPHPLFVSFVAAAVKSK